MREYHLRIYKLGCIDILIVYLLAVLLSTTPSWLKVEPDNLKLIFKTKVTQRFSDFVSKTYLKNISRVVYRSGFADHSNGFQNVEGSFKRRYRIHRYWSPRSKRVKFQRKGYYRTLPEQSFVKLAFCEIWNYFGQLRTSTVSAPPAGIFEGLSIRWMKTFNIIRIRNHDHRRIFVS